MKDLFFGTLLVVVLISAGLVLRWGDGIPPPTNTFLRNCDLIGAHIIDNDTVIVCRVIRRGDVESVEPKQNERKGEHEL